MVRLPDGEGAIPVVLVGNKCDVEMGDGQVDQSYLNRFCEEHEFLAWYDIFLTCHVLMIIIYYFFRFDTSAYTGEGIEQAMRCLVEKILSFPNVFSRKREKNAIFKPELHKGFKDPGCC